MYCDKQIINCKKGIHIRQFRKLLHVLILLGVGLTGLHAQTMFVKTKSGTQTTYALTVIQKITFLSDSISIFKTTGETDKYELANLRYMNFTDLSSGIAELTKITNPFLLYPNPVNSLLNIQHIGFVNQSVSITILSTDGRVVYFRELQNNTATYNIDISELHNGLYFCRISNGTIYETVKFIKQ